MDGCAEDVPELDIRDGFASRLTLEFSVDF